MMITLDIAHLTETVGFERTLWLLMIDDSGYGLSGPDALTDEVSTVIAEGRGLIVAWDTPVTLHYAENL